MRSLLVFSRWWGFECFGGAEAVCFGWRFDGMASKWVSKMIKHAQGKGSM